MPTKIEKDSVTGTETTGHEWDGIKELNTPLPKWWLYTFYVSILVSLIYVILFPAIPGFSGYTGGILGYNQRLTLEEDLASARANQAMWLDRIETASASDVVSDPELLSFALAGGNAVFADNCAPCHGLGGAGQYGYPNLADDDWLWGGTLDDIRQTILHGVRTEEMETRYSEMPQYGVFAMLTRDEMSDTAHYVVSLSGETEDEEAAARGAEVFAQQCAACHGEDGTGGREFGAPNLTDQIWLYGGSHEDIVAQINAPQHGMMPAWGERFDDATIKMLTVYVHSLGGGE